MATETILENDPLAANQPGSDPLALVRTDVAAVLRPVASLRLTVVLFALLIVVIFTGTLAQHRKDIWQVIDEYFRTGIAWIEIQDLFPPSFFPWALDFNWNRLPFQSFPFPGGWLIGTAMAVNLLAAHSVRFRAQARGARLALGIALIGAGMLATWLVVVSGSNKIGIQSATLLGYDRIWQVLLLTVLTSGVATIWTGIRLDAGRRTERWSLTIGGAVIAIAAICLMAGAGEISRLDDSSMRILWQLMKATFAGLILLAGCFLVFNRRAGIVLLHGGIGLLMFGELVVGLYAVESQMRIDEGETRSYIYDIRETELAVIDTTDPNDDHVVAVPESFYAGRDKNADRMIQSELLPFDIEVVRYFRNSDLRRAKPDDDNPATTGLGQQWLAEPAQQSTGTESSVDLASMYINLRSKADGTSLGTHLVTMLLSEQNMLLGRPDEAELVDLDGTKYHLFLRFKRSYRPYAVTLLDVRKDDYVGTETPRNYSSDVRIVNADENIDHQARIWMNNPLRFSGETFYQSGYQKNPVSGKESTTLSVVTNRGWMIPYVSCMIVAVGMLAQFLLTLTRFLDRRNRETTSVARTESTRADLVVPALAILLGVAMFAPMARTPAAANEEFDLYAFGKIPVAYQGREKPLDTLARNSLRIVSDKQGFKDEDGQSQPAIRWLLDVVARPDTAMKHPVFRIEDLELLSSLNLERRDGFRYSAEEIMNSRDELIKQAELAHAVKEKTRLTHFQRKVLELEQRLGVVTLLQAAIRVSDFRLDHAHEDLMTAIQRFRSLRQRQTPLLVPTGVDEESLAWDSLVMSGTRTALRQLAIRSQATTPDELAAWIVGQLPQETVHSTVAALLPMLHEEADKRDGQTLKELARDMSGAMREDYLKDVLLLINGASDVSNAATIISEVPAETIDRIYDSRRNQSFLTMTRDLPDDLVRPVVQKVQAAGAMPTPAMVDQLTVDLTAAVLSEILPDGSINPKQEPVAEQYQAGLDGLLLAWSTQNVSDFNAQTAAYLKSIDSDHPGNVPASKIAFEAWFNHAAPFFRPIFAYLLAFVLAALGWLGWARPLNRAAFCLIALALCVHTLALVSRIYISGRPPVTNLYSSAVFIGWGGVVLGLLLEGIYRIGIGNLIAAVAGSATLGIAHQLAGDGDTFTVLQAVLDTQFWLATHVVCITLGYATTFVAGLLGIAYILLGVLTPVLDAGRRRDMVRMIYGILCFAIFFSFVGTVLGGLWADDSWGRFWGWDPKENGALIIVLWNALVLHARWGGMAKERGMAVLSVFGNIWTAWSWFGVNELGVGLHSYGFTEGVLMMLGLFVVSQLVIAGIGSLPQRMWLSRIAKP